MKTIKIKTGLSVIASILLTVGTLISVDAGSSTSGFKSSATLSSSCIVSATDMSFGTINPAQSGSPAATASITTQCTKGSTYVIGLNEGSAGYIQNNGTWSYLGYIRIMNASGGSQLLYNIFKDSAHTQLFGGPTAWGQSAGNGGQGTAVMVIKTGTGEPDVTNMYGIMPANQFVTPGTYSDTIPVVVSF